jgi:hypothetical protein
VTLVSLTPYRFKLKDRAAIVNRNRIDYTDFMPPPSDKQYLNFIVEPELLKRLDDFRYKNRFPTRAAAIKWLLDWALDQKPKAGE